MFFESISWSSCKPYFEKVTDSDFVSDPAEKEQIESEHIIQSESENDFNETLQKLVEYRQETIKK